MDKRYYPQFELGEFVNAAEIKRQGMGDYVNTVDLQRQGLAGLAGADYSRITAIQNSLSVRNAELNATNRGAWETIWKSLEGKTIPGTSSWFYGRDWTQSQINAALNKALVTSSHVPSEAELAFGETVIRDVGNMIAYYKKTVPEQSGAISSAGTSMASKMNAITPLQDPAVVGWDTFNKEIEARAKALATGFSFGGGMVAAGAAILGLFILSQKARRNPGRGFDVSKLVIPGALAAGAYWYFVMRKADVQKAAVIPAAQALLKQADALDAAAIGNPMMAPTLKAQADALRQQAMSIAKSSGVI
jgi:hypothetical protein